MFKTIKNYSLASLKNPLFTGSLIMFVGTNFHNAGQLLYHYLAINMLSRTHYGDLAALISIFGLLGIFQQSLGLSVVKFIASERDSEAADNLARWVLVWGMWLGIMAAVLIFAVTPFLARFLHITQPYAVYLFAPVVFITFVSGTGRALLQGFVRFTSLSVSMIAEVCTKILLTVVFLYLGYGLLGAVVGLLGAAALGLVVVWLSLKDKVSARPQAMPNIKPIIQYSFPVLIQSLATTAMYSTDIILVKHFFVPDTAGAYAALSKLGTIALFVSAPITNVMFPHIAQKHARGEAYNKVFYGSLSIIIGLSSSIVLLYAFWGKEIANILTHGKYVHESYLLWWFGLYMLLLGTAILFTQFYLSVGKTKVVWLFAQAAVLQGVLILFFHATLINVIQVSILSAALLVFSLSIYFPYHKR